MHQKSSPCRQALNEATKDLGFRQLGKSYDRAPSISLDYAIMEKARNIVCVPLATSWSDVGSWSELWNFLEKDESGNVVKGEGSVLVENASGNYAYSDHACVALVGVENLVVVAMGDAVLVASREQRRVDKVLWSSNSRATARTSRFSTTASTARGVGIKVSIEENATK